MAAPGSQAYTLLGLTAFVAALVGVLAFALARFVWSARDTRRHLTGSTRGESEFVTAAVAAALGRGAGTVEAGPVGLGAPGAWYRELAAHLAERCRQDAAAARRALSAAAGLDRSSSDAIEAPLRRIVLACDAAAMLAGAGGSRAVVDLHALAQQVATDYRPAARQHGGDVLVQGRFAPVTGDEALLRHAVTHLVQRALAACERTGVAPVVTLCGEARPGEAVVHLAVAGNGGSSADAVPGGEASGDRAADQLGLELVRRVVLAGGGACRAGVGAMGGEQIDLALSRAADR